MADCSVDECGKPHLARGYCSTHYNLARRSGDLICCPPDRVNSGRACRVDGCAKGAYGRGYCQAHYERLRKYGDPFGSAPKKTGGPCSVSGCHRAVAAKGVCRTHYNRMKKHGDPEAYSAWYLKRFDPIVDSDGYVHIYAPDHANTKRNSRIPEHRYVMSEILGRPLADDENVHHKNGVKSDNRPDNLELWVTSQPSGQRVEDLVTWARSILNRYPEKELAALGLN